MGSLVTAENKIQVTAKQKQKKASWLHDVGCMMSAT